METKVAVLGFNNWEMEDGRCGTTLYYLPSVPLEEQNKRGLFPVKKSISNSLANVVRTMPIPCVTTMTFDVAGSVSGKMDIVITGFKDFAPLEIFE